MQQSLEYLHVPHDVQLPPNRQVLLARRDVPNASLEEGSPDHLGATLDVADDDTPATPAAAKPSPVSAQIVSAALTARDEDHPAATATTAGANSPAAAIQSAPESAMQSATRAGNSLPQKLPTSGTVVLDVEEGGIPVPSFLGKNLRSVIEAAQDAGLELDAVGSGVAREQSPQPGAHVATGSRITVRFGR
jgi:cell division protein FtsI (penicillin-binding protein 3)